MTKTVVYIAGPFRGKNAWEVAQNVRRAEDAAFEVAKLGMSFVCPHLQGAHFDGTLTDEYWLEMTLELMRRCDVVLLLDGYENSHGTKGEIAEAAKLKIPIYNSVMVLRAMTL